MVTPSPQDPPTWQQVVSRAIRLRAEQAASESIGYEELVGEDLTLEQVAELLVVIGEVATAAYKAKAAIAAHLASQFETEGRTSIEVAGMLVLFKPKRTLRVKDPDGFWEYMRANPELLDPAFNPNNIRKTGIPESVFDTFFEYEVGHTPEITEVPMWVIEDNKRRKEQQS